MNDLSIEYAHIYTNAKIGAEHTLSLEILQALYQQQPPKAASLLVLVDDYSFPDPTFDYRSFTAWLGSQGFKPDLLFRESQLIPVCDEVLKLVQNSKLREQLCDYIRSKKYPCSLFIAAWYLLRLGHLRSPLFHEALIAEQLMNILPSSFKPFEDMALSIIAATPFKSALEKITYQYHEGRLLA